MEDNRELPSCFFYPHTFERVDSSVKTNPEPDAD